MKRVIKTIDIEKGILYVRTNDYRYRFAKCNAEIEIIEEFTNIPCLGKGNIIKSRNLCMLITVNHFERNLDIESVEAFDFVGEILRKDGIYEKIQFVNCLVATELDLTQEGVCEFEVNCTKELMRKLMNS